MGWFWSNDKDKDKKKKKDGKEDSPIIKITHDDASTNRGFQIDTSNMASEDQERGVDAYVSSHHNVKIFEKDDLAQVKKELAEDKNITLLEKIGSGHYAEVYRGHNTYTGRDVAIKIIILTSTNLRYQEVNLPQEIECLQKLQHRRIIRLYMIFQTDNKVVMVMEYAERGTLGDLIQQKGALRELACWALFREVFYAVKYMHQNSYAHRDIKLENILITRGMVPKLCDFSFTVKWDGKTPSHQWCGSLPYFAPELLRMQSYNPLKVDIWAFGVCLFIMANDKEPFKCGKAEEEKQMLSAQLEKKWTLRSRTEKKYSPNYKDLLDRMLEPDLDRRITVNGMAKHPWITTDLSPNRT